MDWATNYEIYMKDVENPLKKHAGQPETVRFHNGFHDYMFGPNSHGTIKGPNGEDLSQYQEIFQEHLLPILKRNYGYKVRVEFRLECVLTCAPVFVVLTIFSHPVALRNGSQSWCGPGNAFRLSSSGGTRYGRSQTRELVWNCRAVRGR